MREECGLKVWGQTEVCPRFANVSGKADRNRLDADESARPAFIFKCNDTGDFCKKSVVSADADIFPGLELCSTLPNEDGAAADELTAESFYAKSLRMTVAAVS